MRSIVKITAFCLFVLPISMGAIYIDDPASGTLPAGTQQPAGTVTLGGYTATDQVTGSFTNYGPGFYHSGSYFCDE